MDADATDDLFERACARLFELHANGFVRPKPRPIRPVPAPPTRRAAVVAGPRRVSASII